MGLFGGNISFGDFPQRRFKTADQIFRDALSFGRGEFPLAMGSREEALRRIQAGDLEPGMEFFEQFGPTSFEEGISGTFFEDALEKASRTSGHRASLSGMEASFPELFSKAISPTIFNIGKFLSNLGQRRSELALRGRESGILQMLGIDPLQAVSPFVETDISQSNLQTEADFQTALQNAIRDFQKRSAAANLFSTIGKTGGGILGSIFGGPIGGAVGSEIGGGIGDLFEPNVQDISHITGARKPAKTGGGLDIATLADLFDGTETTGKTKRVSTGQNIFDFLKNL